MILLLAFLILLMAWVALICKKQRACLVGLSLGLILIFLVGSGALPSFILARLQSYAPLKSPAWKERNFIVLLGGGTVRWGSSDTVQSNSLASARLLETARLYLDCKAQQHICRVLPSGADPLRNGVSEAAVMARELQNLGVLETDIVLEAQSRNTFQNAQFSSPILQSSGFEHIVLVTSGFHMRRALFHFAHFRVTAVPAPADYLKPILSPRPLSLNFTFMDLALHEYAGVLYYQFLHATGWKP